MNNPMQQMQMQQIQNMMNQLSSLYSQIEKAGEVKAMQALFLGT